MKGKLKIGLFVNSFIIPSWALSMIKELHSSEYCRIELIITGNCQRSEASLILKLSLLPFILHKKMDALIFSGKNNCEKGESLTQLSDEVPCLNLCITDKVSDGDPEIDILDKIRSYDLDVIINLGYGQVSKDISEIPSFGVWSYNFSDFTDKSKDTTGYYEVVKKEPITGLELYSVKEAGLKKKVLARLFESTISYSVSLNRDKLFKRASLCIPRIIQGIYFNGDDYLTRLEKRCLLESAELKKNRNVPRFYASIINILTSGMHLLRQVFKKICYSDPFSWVLLYNIGNDKDFLNNNYKKFKQIKPGREKFWADPFVVYKDEKYYLFVEEFIYSMNKGHISVLELDKKGVLINSGIALKKSYHLSYPFIVEADGDYYMIPESGQNRTIDLYKSAGFPYKWNYVKTIMNNLNAVDTTLFYHDNKWWLFTLIENIESAQENSPELFVFYSDNFLSDKWISHPLNPVVTDVRKARPAGRIFKSDGVIYRPGQDCSERYGQAFSFNKISRLSTTEYMEEQVLRVQPDWARDLKGTHTFNTDGDITIIDAYNFRRRFL
ncbi:MAG: glucosamine inositolphosphorylceramide transferase family protein [Bacteroidales bacterium]|jgi:hypothetical protein